MAGMETPHISELVRRIENLLRVGTIAKVDAKRYRVRAATGGMVSNWIPWFTLRAGAVRRWSAPSVGEQCALLSPGGDLANGIALGGIFSDAIPPNADSENIHRTTYPDGTVEEYDHDAHRALLQCVGDIVRKAQGNVSCDANGTITHRAAGAIVIESDTSITLRVGSQEIAITPSAITATPDILGGGRISLVGHVHGEIKRGGELSGGPQ